MIFFVLIIWGWSSHAQFGCDPSAPNFRDCFINSQDVSQTGTLAGKDFLELLQNIGGFLMIAGGLIAGICIIVAGFLWISAGSDTARLATAKAVFKNGVIGALILFASGVIINTVVLFAGNWRQFFS